MSTTMTEKTASAEQTVVVRVAGELYGIEITAVQEIIRVPPITRVPNTSMSILGVTNLRGRIVPVMDLRVLLGAEVAEATLASRVVIINQPDGAIGLWVDGVSEVLDVYDADIDPSSTIDWLADATTLRGVAKLEGRLVGLLDMERLLADGAAW